MRNRIAIVLLYASWPVCIIHRLWNNDPMRSVRWIAFDKDVNQDFRWYLVYNEIWLSGLFVIVAFLIATSITKSIKITLVALTIVCIIDIVNYWLWFRRSEIMLTFEGLTMLTASLILTYVSKRKYEKTA